MELVNCKNLLEQVNSIVIRYDKINEITGENFNVFRILKLDSSEVRMHSAFIAELLNPNGSHGQKNSFLNLFVKEFCFKKKDIDTLSCKVKVEDYIGLMNVDKTEGGRIDITVRDKNNHVIIIENKIYAGDQEHQLTRYSNYSNDADIIYLTLEGNAPSDYSRGDMKEDVDYKCYSYRHHLLNWLELCRKEVAVHPLVREAISHYINLVKHLTNQTQNQNMQEELSDLLKSNLLSSFEIANNLKVACQKVSDDFGNTIEEAFRELGLECDYGIDFEKKYTGIWIWKPNWKHVGIGFQFQNCDKYMIYGFATKKDPVEFPIPTALRDELHALSNNSPRVNQWWPWFRLLEYPFDNWSKIDAWKALLNGDTKAMLIEKTQHLIKLAEGIEM